MKNFIKFCIFSFLFFLTGMSFAQMGGPKPPPMPNMQSAFPGMEMGMLEGDLFEIGKDGAKKFLPNEEVIIKVFQQEQEVLSLHKPTDDKGHFIFKNIFKDPTFEYALGYYNGEKLYILNGLSLTKDQDSLKVEFRVGEGSPYLVPEEILKQQQQQSSQSGNVPSSGGGMTAGGNASAVKNVSGLWQDPYQKVALVLSLLVIVAFIFMYQKQSQKKTSAPVLAKSNADEPGTPSSDEDKDLFLLNWLHEKFTKGQLPEAIYRAQEAKILERLKQGNP